MSDRNAYRTWQKASRSSDQQGCFEVSFDVPGMVGVRDSKRGDAGPVLEFTQHEFDCFLDGARKGEFTRPE